MTTKPQYCDTHPDTELILTGCYVCGAPVCCPDCCKESTREYFEDREARIDKVLAEVEKRWIN